MLVQHMFAGVVIKKWRFSFLQNLDQKALRFPLEMLLYYHHHIQSTPDNSNLQGKSKKGSSYWEFEENSRE